MLMRIFLLVLIGVMAATSVSCVDVPAAVPISVACNASSTALFHNPEVNVGESYIVKSGCTVLNFNNDYIKNGCPQNTVTEFYTCGCETTLANTSYWESVVSNSSGRSCYIDLEIILTGTEIINNQTRPTQVTHTHYNFGLFAVGNACNKTEIEETALLPFANEGVGFVDSSLNANSNVSGVIWSSGTVTVSACGASRTVFKVIPSSNTGGTTTAPPTTSSGSSSNTNTNTNSTSSPSTVSPVTPAPTNISSSSSSSSSSSTGDRGTGTTGNGNGNGASSIGMMHFVNAVMVTVISTILAVIGAA